MNTLSTSVPSTSEQTAELGRHEHPPQQVQSAPHERLVQRHEQWIAGLERERQNERSLRLTVPLR